MSVLAWEGNVATVAVPDPDGDGVAGLARVDLAGMAVVWRDLPAVIETLELTPPTLGREARLRMSVPLGQLKKAPLAADAPDVLERPFYVLVDGRAWVPIVNDTDARRVQGGRMHFWFIEAVADDALPEETVR